MSKIKLEDVITTCTEKNWKVISTEYKNLKEDMKFECPKGHSVIAPWESIRKNFLCPVCRQEQFEKDIVEVKKKGEGVKRVLALDQATRVTGYSIYDNQQYVASGVFKTNFDNEIQRNNQMRNWLINMDNQWNPDIIAIEDIQLQENVGSAAMGVTTYKVLAHLQGVLIETIFELGKQSMVCSPATWRAFCKVKGRTRTDKKRSMELIAQQLINETVSDDQADAIGIGLYASNSVGKKKGFGEFA